ncbi:7TM-DISM domain-containing protein [Shewanella sp. HL-SH5]|uniref:7TM-DISM domain-containing protein n=1 Tax=Shewanella sp. HL-SH5 TaxID=3436241 RepID=UPI003EBA75BF
MNIRQQLSVSPLYKGYSNINPLLFRVFVIRFLWLLLLLFYSLCATSKTIELSNVSSELFINEHLSILQDSSANLSYQNALTQYKQGLFTENRDKKVSFGFTHDVLWASVLINNASAEEVKRVFYLDTA